MLPSDEYTEFESRQYINPQTVVDESNTFIDQLRATQGQQNQEITQQTQRLGTDVPTNLGGLTGGESYFSSRYQTPQTASVVADLRTTAQAAALNEALANEEAKWKKRYNDAYRAYQKSAYDKENSQTTSDTGIKGGVEEENVPPNDSLDAVSTSETEKDPIMDFIQGKGDWTISYTNNGKTYYANVFYKTGISGDRYTGIDTSTGMSYSGQNALNYLNGIVSKGGKIYGPDGNEVTPQQALTGAPGRW